MKTKLLHVRANVSDLNRAIEWYENVIGFKVNGTWPHEKPNYAHFEVGEGAIFSIMEDPNVPSHARFNFTVDNVDGLWESMKDKAEVVEEIFNTPYGTRKFTIRDLDGNELGFVRGPK